MQLMSIKTFAKSLNDLTFTDYYNRLMLLARSVFKWENLPNNMDERWIENSLFHEGKCVFYNDETRGLMVAQCTADGSLNNYGDPTNITPYGIDIENKSLTPGVDCVLIRNNDEMIPTSETLKLFAFRLADISRTIDVNVNAQKTPVLILTTEKGRLTLKNIYTQWNGNEPVIYGDKLLDPEQFKALRTDAPIVFPQLQVEKQTLWNECLTFLGINNANTEKRERLITDEVEANNDHIDLSGECFLKARQMAADAINEIFGTDIKVSFRKEGEKECAPSTQQQLEV